MKFDLPPEIDTIQALSACVEELRLHYQIAVEKELAQRVGVENVIATNRSDSKKIAMSKDVHALVGKDSESRVLADAIHFLDDFRTHAITVELTVTAIPDLSSRTKLVAWFRKMYSPYTLLSYEDDPKIGGGIIVRTPFHIYDYSYAKQLIRKRPALIEAIKHV